MALSPESIEISKIYESKLSEQNKYDKLYDRFNNLQFGTDNPSVFFEALLALIDSYPSFGPDKDAKLFYLLFIKEYAFQKKAKQSKANLLKIKAKYFELSRIGFEITDEKLKDLINAIEHDRASFERFTSTKKIVSEPKHTALASAGLGGTGITPTPGVAPSATSVKPTDSSTSTDSKIVACMKQDHIEHTSSELREFFNDLTYLQIYFLNLINWIKSEEKDDELEERVSKLENPSVSAADMIIGISVAIVTGFAGGFIAGGISAKITSKFFKKFAESNAIGKGLSDAIKGSLGKLFFTAFEIIQQEIKDDGSKKEAYILTALKDVIKTSIKYNRCRALHGSLSSKDIENLRDVISRKMQIMSDNEDDFKIWLKQEIHHNVFAITMKPGTNIFSKKAYEIYIINSDVIKKRILIDGIPNKIPEEKQLDIILKRFFECEHRAMGFTIEDDNLYKSFQHISDRSSFIKHLTEHYWSKPYSDSSDFTFNFNIFVDVTEKLPFWGVEMIFHEGSDGVETIRYWYIAHVPPLLEVYVMTWFKLSFPNLVPKPLAPETLFEKGNLKQFQIGLEKQKIIRAFYKKFHE